MKALRSLFFLFLILLLVVMKGEEAQGQTSNGLRPAGRTVEMEEIASVIGAHFQELIQDERKRVEVKEVSGYEKIIVPSGVLTYEVLLPEQASRGRAISPTIVFSVNGREAKKARFRARVDIYGPVWVATRHLKRHHVIEAGDIQAVSRNLSLLPPDVVTEPQELIGKRTVLSVNPNEVLRMGMVEIPPLINKGDQVVLLIESDRYRITALGEAREAGRKGDRLKLINLASRKEVYGKVLDAHTVQIDFR